MGNSNRKFEDSWRAAFHGKEMSPSSELWNNLDAHLANKEAKKYRKGIFFYKWVAAAAVLIAFGLGIYSYVEFGNDKTQLVDKIEVNNDRNSKTEISSENDTKELANSEQGKTTDQKYNESLSSIASNSGASAESEPISINATNDLGRNVSQGQSSLPIVIHELPTLQQKTAALGDRNLLAFMDSRGLTLTSLELEHPDLVINKFVIFADDPFKKTIDNLKDVWAGIDVAGGQFDPNVLSGDGAIASLNGQADFRAAFDQSFESVTPGNSYSFNVNVGKKIAKRWMVQSGLSYLNYSSNTTTHTYFVDNNNLKTAAFYNLSSDDLGNVATIENASNINLNSSLEFISVPIKAGYVLLNKKLSVILLAGVSSDFFLANRVKADDDSFADIVIKGGDESPYNKVHFNGLMSTQVRYQFSENYSLTLEPSYAVAINSLTKIDRYASSLPNVFNLGLGLKYHFR